MAEYAVPKFLKRDGDALLFNDEGELIFYIPETYFDRGDALIVGEYVNLLGIFDYAIFDEKGKNSGLKRFFFPTVFLSKPYAIEKQKKVRLKKNQPVADYRLIRFKKGDPVIVSTKVPMNNNNIESFYKIFLYGKLPNTIPIDKLQDYFTENIALNGSSYGISLQIFGFIIGCMARDAKDLHKEFRHTKYTDPTDYKMISIMDLPKYISPYQSIGSQNWENTVVGSIMNPTNVDSPMDKLLMG